MIIATTWKSRPISPEQFNRLMTVWGKLEEKIAKDKSSERLCWYLNADGSGGVTVDRVDDETTAAALQLELGLSLGEFIDIDSKIVLDMDSAMPSIIAAQGLANS